MLFGYPSHIPSFMLGETKNGVQGVENVYTQHTPLLVQTLELLVKGRLKETEYPVMGRAQANGQPARAPRLVVAFIVGGSTYEEARAVADLNTQVRISMTLCICCNTLIPG